MIEWYIKKEEKDVLRNEYFAGTYRGEEPLRATVYGWNNRYGENIAPAYENFSLIVRFLEREDSALLEFLSIEVDGAVQTPIRTANSLVFSIQRRLAGEPNDGSFEGNEGNYFKIDATFDAPGVVLKNDDIKNLIFEITE